MLRRWHLYWVLENGLELYVRVGVRAFQTARITCLKALGQERVWHVVGTERTAGHL